MSKRDENAILKSELNNAKLDVRKAAVKKVIGAMTVGKDVAQLFTDVLKCVETEDLELKKLVYLYIINYAKAQPDLALMAINTFRKDSTERVNPLIRSLAVRTMGCIGIEQMLEYLLGPLQDAMNDEDAYVRKTAAMCVAKVYEINQLRVEQVGLLAKLRDMLQDGNGMVVSNATAAITEIKASKGLWFEITPKMVHALLNAIPETGEWGRISILDFLADNLKPSLFQDDHVQRVIPHLAHSNPSVVLSACKLVILFLSDLEANSDKSRSLQRKLAPPLISLMNNEPEIQFVALKNINLILQRWPSLFDKEVRVFFCSFQDPLYIKLEKLELLVRLADLRNIDLLLSEFKEYAQEIDVVFARKAISSVGRIAVKLGDAAERCVLAFHELIRTKVAAQYVIEEIVIVIKDIFRQYPNRYENIIKDLCSHLKTLDNADARAAMVWIIGEYGDRIENAVQLMYFFSSNFKDEAKQVQMAILTAAVKLYLRLGEEQSESLVTQILKEATDESDNPDLRNRGYIYWRMLSEDPDSAKQIILCERPSIRLDQSSLDPSLRDSLLQNISKLSSVYYKLPENFVKKIRDRQNQLEEEQERDAGDLLGQNEVYQIDSVGVKREEYEVSHPVGDYQLYSQGTGNLLDIQEESKLEPTILEQIIEQTHSGTLQTLPTDLLSELSISNTANYIRAPQKTVLSALQTGSQKQKSGLQITAAVQRSSQSNCCLEMQITNSSTEYLSNFVMKLNSNYLGLIINEDFPKIEIIPGQTAEVKLRCLLNGQERQPAPQKPPIIVQAGLMCSLDLFYFEIPVLFQVCLNVCPQAKLLQPEKGEPQVQHTIPKMSSQINNSAQLIKRLEEHNINLSSQVNRSFFFCSTTQFGDICRCEIEIQPPTAVLIRAWCSTSAEANLFIQAIQFIITN